MLEFPLSEKANSMFLSVQSYMQIHPLSGFRTPVLHIYSTRPFTLSVGFFLPHILSKNTSEKFSKMS